MSDLNDVELLISFDELKQLEIDVVPAWADKYNALSICKGSLAEPSEIYKLWVQKLFKAYDLKEFTNNDWRIIIEYLKDILDGFVKNLDPLKDTARQQLNQWWQDTKDLLTWLWSIIDSVDAEIVYLLMILALEIVIKTCKYASGRNVMPILAIQQLIVNFSNNYVMKQTINNNNEFKIFNEIISSICDVGNAISSFDIKTSVETWRTVAKLSEKYKKIPFNDAVDNVQWYSTAILGIFKELNLLINIFKQKSDGSTDNLLQVCQFYLKTLKLITQYLGFELNNLPVMKGLIDFYSLWQHCLAKDKREKVALILNQSIIDIFSLVFKENSMQTIILQHLKEDQDKREMCTLLFDFLKLTVEHAQKFGRLDNSFLLKLYNQLFSGNLIFIDGDKYYKVIENYVVLCVLDSSGELHQKLCEYILDSTWTRAYTSMEILALYYSFIFKDKKSKVILTTCLQYWVKIWYNINKSKEPIQNQKHLVEQVLKTIIENTEDAVLQDLSNKFENFEIVLLKSGQHNDKLKQYFETNLVKYLNKLQERKIKRLAYKELLNLMDIAASRPANVNSVMKVSLFETFTSLFTLQETEFLKLREFFNKTLRILYLLQDEQLNEKLLKHLTQHLQHCCNLHSINLIKFLLTQRPQANKFLETLKTTDMISCEIISLMDCSNLPSGNQFTVDLMLIQELIEQKSQTNTLQKDLEQISKRPRLDISSSDIQTILNDMKQNSEKLIKHKHFDAKDFELLNEIKNNIDKCLTNSDC